MCVSLKRKRGSRRRGWQKAGAGRRPDDETGGGDDFATYTACIRCESPDYEYCVMCHVVCGFVFVDDRRGARQQSACIDDVSKRYVSYVVSDRASGPGPERLTVR